MCRCKRRGGLTMLEVLIIIGIVVCIVIMLLPAIQISRERARRGQCVDNLKSLGVAMSAHVDAHNRFPSSSGVSRDADGKITAVDGWSWSVSLLPFLDKQKLYDSLNVANGRPLIEREGVQGVPHANALATSLPGLLCPSFARSSSVDPMTNKAAITNYKAMGATHMESLSVASPYPLTPKYNPDGISMTTKHSSVPYHPDGGCFPGTGLKFDEYTDGLSNTILLVETVEPQFSRWAVGAEASVVGLPRIVEFERCADNGHFTPKGLSNVKTMPGSGKESGDQWDPTSVAPVYWTYRTYLNWDYDKKPYDGADGIKAGKYGPSSHHPEVINHLRADGAAFSLHIDIDVDIYMHFITRHGRDSLLDWP